MSKKNLAVRQCAVTYESLLKNDLIRIAKVNNQVIIDLEQNMGGRGCYLKKDIKVINTAKKRLVLNQRLRTDVSSDIYIQLLNLIK